MQLRWPRVFELSCELGVSFRSPSLGEDHYLSAKRASSNKVLPAGKPNLYQNRWTAA
jgi:hypothetical protein